GSDAVGGVVNFITRRDLDGWEFTGNYTGIDGSKGDYDISGARGWKFDRGDALLTATYRRRSELRTTDRGWALRSFAENNFGGTSPYPAVGLNQQSRFYVPANNPGLLAFLAVPANCAGTMAAICANAAANGAITSQTAWRPEGYGGNPLFEDGADHQRRQATAFRVGGSLKGKVFDDIGLTVSATYQRNHGEGGAGPDIAVNRLQLALRGLGGPGCNP